MESSAKRSTALSRRFKQVSKSIVALFLCIALVFGYSYKEPVTVQAAAEGYEIGQIVRTIVYAILAATGVSASKNYNNNDLGEDMAKIWGHAKTVFEATTAAAGATLESQFQIIVDKGKTLISGPKSAILAVIQAILNYYPQVSSTQITSSIIGSYITNEDLDKLLGFPIRAHGTYIGGGVTNTVNFAKVIAGWNFTETQSSTGCQLSPFTAFGTTLTFNYLYSTGFWYLSNGTATANVGEFSYWGPTANYYLISVQKALGESAKNYLVWDTSLPLATNSNFIGIDCLLGSQSIPYTGPDVFNPANKDLYADGYSIMNHTLTDVLARIGALQRQQDRIRLDIGDVVGDLTQINDQIKSLTQSRVLDADISDTSDKDADDTKNKDRDTNPPKMPNMPDLTLPSGLQKKFPFCLPWDLVACYKLFQVPAKAPTWSIPVNIDQGLIHVHQTYTYDLNSNKVMDTLLPIFKWFLNISVVIGLIAITRKIMS